jgi:hypothetical protein
MFLMIDARMKHKHRRRALTIANNVRQALVGKGVLYSVTKE